jgi:hypothetical protein
MAENGPSPPRLAPRSNALSSPLSRFFASSTRVDPLVEGYRCKVKVFGRMRHVFANAELLAAAALWGPLYSTWYCRVQGVLYFVLQSEYVQGRQELGSSQHSHTRNPSVSVQSTLTHSQFVAVKVRMMVCGQVLRRPGEDPNAWKQFAPEPDPAVEPQAACGGVPPFQRTLTGPSAAPGGGRLDTQRAG